MLAGEESMLKKGVYSTRAKTVKKVGVLWYGEDEKNISGRRSESSTPGAEVTRTSPT